MSDGTPAGLLAVAERAAREAGALLVERYGRAAVGVDTKSTPTDPVSEADLAAERAIRERLARERPDDAVVGEEGGGDGGVGSSGLRWVVDPLDGTVNYLYRLPAWCVTLACQDAAGTVAGVVHDPLRGETFQARRDGPPQLDGDDVSASRVQDLGQALVGTGFGYDAQRRARQGEVAARVLARARDLRRVGAAGLDLAWTGAGRLDAFYERGLNPWDAAAGALLCERAGLVVRELTAAGGLPGGLMAAPAAIADELYALVG